MIEHRLTPSASILIESVRDIGYTLESALADIVDNSITAGASEVRIVGRHNEEGFQIAIADNGTGMSQDALLQAMRLGSSNPRQVRDASDLGRFGLGLKTASFSQCRRLSVVSRDEDGVSGAIWDLDHVVERDDWVVQIPADPSSLPMAEMLGETGTVVLWEKLDRVVGDSMDGNQQVRMFDAALVAAEEHLALVFHRFLSHEARLPHLDLYINNKRVEPHDPFFARHRNTHFDPSDTYTIGGHPVTLQAFTLPRRKWVSESDWRKYAGREGYVRNQGIYLYRAGRLIIHGTWFRLARQEELTKLSRVKLDMPNALDAVWRIDVKKASAQLPPAVRDWIRRLLDRMLARPRSVIDAPSTRALDDATDGAPWLRVERDGVVHYRFNPEFGLYADFASRLDDEMRADFASLVDKLEASLPVRAIYVDYAKDPGQLDEEGTDAVARVQFREFAKDFFVRRFSAGMERDELESLLRTTPQFSNNWKATIAILDEVEQERSLAGEL